MAVTVPTVPVCLSPSRPSVLRKSGVTMTPPEDFQTSLLSILSSNGALTKDALIITKQGHISRTSDADLSDISNCASSKAVWGTP